MADRLPLILIPGLLCTKELWRHQIDNLSDLADITVPDTTRRHEIPWIAQDILKYAPTEFALAGLSMGGYIAFEILRQEPRRVRRLALLDTNARADLPEQQAARRVTMQQVEKGEFRGVTGQLIPKLLHPDHLNDRTLTDLIKSMALEVGKDGYLRQQTAIIGRPDNRPLLKTIEVSTLVLVGRQDALTPPKVAEEIANGIENSELVIIEECGHLSTLEKPAEVTGHMRRWLTVE
jgi:pimeloyl-ACP methyl ester carboxylesterase